MNNSFRDNKHKELLSGILPEGISEHEKQLWLALSDCVLLLCEFNLTQNKMIGTPLRFYNGAVYSLYETLNIDNNCDFSEFVKIMSMELEGADKDSFLSFCDSTHLFSCFDNGQTHLKIIQCASEDDAAPARELHVLLYSNEGSEDVSGFAYMIPSLERNVLLNKLNNESEKDDLTGCYTRSTLRRIVPQYLESPDAKAAFIMVDLDNFKKANDMGGHHFGDQILSDTAQIIRSCFRSDDLIVRMGGDEFAVFVAGVNDRETIRAIVQRLLRTTEKNYETEDGVSINITISIGIALYPECGTTLDQLYRNADEALYRAKALGKNAYSFYKDISEGKALNEIFKKGFRDSDCRDILDALVHTGIFVIEEATHRILFYNRHMKNVVPHVAIGSVCHELWEATCDHCPINTMGHGSWSRTYDVNSPFGESCEITATRMLWQGNTPAVLIRIWPERIEGQRSVLTEADKDHFDISKYDALTGGFTRKGFIETVENMRVRGINLKKYAVLFVNIKGFKAINELFGSDAGDSLLRTVFTHISNSSLSPLISARKESDHFIFLVEINDLDYDVLRTLLEFRWKVNAQEVSIHCRCGIYKIDNNDRSVAGMIDRAKLAKEHITDEFVEPYCVFEKNMRVNYVEQMFALATFEEAIERREFEVYYQPVMDARTQRIISAEALVRWCSTDHGTIPPGQFIPILEQSGYITKLDSFVLGEVENFQMDCLQNGMPIVPVTVNLSRMDFYDQSSLNETIGRYRNSSLPKGSVNFEITESTRGEGAMEAKENFIDSIRECGGKIYLDDFGNGYSTFDMIENYSFDVLKIDMGLIRKLVTDPKLRTIVQAIIFMSHNLNMSVVAEGVEHEKELKILQELKCDSIQGYYFSKPLPVNEFKKFVAESM